MKKNLFGAVDGQRLYEYLLIISPDETVGTRLNEIKLFFDEAYGCKKAAHLKPHITMIHFFLYESAEFRIVNCFDRFARSIKPFIINLNGFGYFGTHTMYVKLESTAQVLNLVGSLKLRFKNLLGTVAGLTSKFIAEPHLTIAREMTPEQFEAAWARWKKEDFIDAFEVNQMRLIKREFDPETLSSIGKYKPVQDFIFSAQFTEEQLVLTL